MTFDEFAQLAFALGEVQEHVKKTEIDLTRKGGHIARLRSKGTIIAIRLPWDVIDELLAEPSDTFFVTDHYRGSPYIVAKIASLDKGVAKRLILESWEIAPYDLPKRY